MFKNKFLGGTSFLPFFDKEDGTGGTAEVKTPAQIRQEQRDSIVVDTGGGNPPAEETEEEDETEEETEEEDEENEEEEEETEEENETPEQKTARVAAAKEARKQERINKRIGKYKSAADTLAEENARLKRQIEEKAPEDKLTEEEVERRAEAKAAEKLAQKNVEREDEKFASDKDKLTKQGIKKDPEFIAKVLETAEEYDLIPKTMIGILANELDHDNGGEVLAYLAQEDNREEYGEIIELSPIRMAKRLEKISDKLNEEKVAKKKKNARQSSAPEPITPVSESNVRSITLTGKESTEDFVRIRNQQAAERAKNRFR